MNLNNRVQLIGKAASQTIVKTYNNVKMARFSISTTDAVKKFDRITTETQWHQVVAWDKQAEQAEKEILEGSEIIIDGRIIHRSYTDKDGKKMYITEIVAETILINNSNINKNMSNKKIA